MKKPTQFKQFKRSVLREAEGESDEKRESMRKALRSEKPFLKRYMDRRAGKFDDDMGPDEVGESQSKAEGQAIDELYKQLKNPTYD